MKDSKNFLFTFNIFLWKLDNGVMFLYVLNIYRKQLYTQQGKKYNEMKHVSKYPLSLVQQFFGNKFSLSHA
jgi:hypothetical protein